MTKRYATGAVHMVTLAPGENVRFGDLMVIDPKTGFVRKWVSQMEPGPDFMFRPSPPESKGRADTARPQ